MRRVQENPEWETIDMAVDCGASEIAIGEKMFQGKVGEASKRGKAGETSMRGVQYEVANGVRIPNLGGGSCRASRRTELREASPPRCAMSAWDC